jgi:undecaprenyl-diphosphatase
MTELWSLDQRIFRDVHLGGHQPWLDPFFWVISTTGLGWVQALLFLAWPLVRDWPGFGGVWARWKEPGYLVGPLLAVYAFSGLVASQLVKELIERERPSNFAWARPQEGFFFNSYPSGHTTTSFALAFLVALATWHKDRRIGLAFLAWAALVGYSRIYRGVHWPSDVIGGVFAGLLSAALVLLVFRQRSASSMPSA